MATRFKLRFSRVMPSFQFCRSKHPSTFPQSPIRVNYRPSPLNPKALDLNYPNPPPSTPQDITPVHPSDTRRVVRRAVSVDCGCRSKSCVQLSSDYTIQSPDYTWTRESKWGTVGRVEVDEEPRQKVCNMAVPGDIEEDGSATPLLSTKKQLKKLRSKKKNAKAKIHTSASSGGGSGCFTSEETETFLSSGSFSSDTSFVDQIESKNTKSSPNRSKKTEVNKLGKLKRYASKKWNKSPSAKTKMPESKSPLGMSVLRRVMPCNMDGKVMESFAVVKKSEDPYEDFKRSMLEMIMEKQMFNAKDLEELLHCFLCLNSRLHHRVIVEAFSEIWEVLFSRASVK